MNDDDKTCQLCGEKLSYHRDLTGDCPATNASTPQWHPINRFTPQPMPAQNSNAICAHCIEPFSLHDKGNQSCPVIRYGKRVGWAANKFLAPSAAAANTSPAPPSPQSEAQDQAKCRHCGKSVDFHSIKTSRCPDGMNEFMPEIPSQPQSELDRQIEVMKASKEAGAVVECRLRGTNNEWVFANPDWNWQSYDYRIRPQPPAPEKARRVWINVTRSGFLNGSTTKEHAATLIPDGYDLNNVEFIELTPAVRVELNAVLEALCQFANATAIGLALREVEHEAQTLLTKLPAVRAAVEREGLL